MAPRQEPHDAVEGSNFLLLQTSPFSARVTMSVNSWSSPVAGTFSRIVLAPVRHCLEGWTSAMSDTHSLSFAAFPDFSASSATCTTDSITDVSMSLKSAWPLSIPAPVVE